MEEYRYSPEERALLESLQQPLAIYQFIDNHVHALILSDGFCELFGYRDRAEAYADMNRDLYENVHPDDAPRIAGAAYRFATEDSRYEVIYRAKAKDSREYRVFHACGKHVCTDGVRLAHVWYTDEGAYVSGVGINNSLSNALHEESLLKASHYDYLTGLPSMSYFFEIAEAGKESICREGDDVVLLYMDLYGMKFFNRSFSFEQGDRLLKAFALLLSRSFGRENCCRVGADHFAVYTRESRIEERLEHFFRDCLNINGGNALPVRVGIYTSRTEDVPVSMACDRAKMACDSLKDIYRSCFRYFTRELSDEAIKRQYVIENLDRALEERWIQVWYQPIVRAVNGRVCDEEALARWLDPVDGLLSPIDFIPALEKAGLSYKLDLYVLERILEKLRLQKEAGLHLVPQSLNLSRSDFDSCDIVEEIRARVDAAGIDRDMLTVEITESVVGRDFAFMREQIQRFQSLGFPVWMDDFGSGYSSLDVLQSIKFNLLKFDMSFMQKLDEGEKGKIILTELMKMATALGVDTVCEGVEKEEQVRFLQEIGCSKLQGYYFTRPIPFEQILDRYENGRQIGFENPVESAYYEAIGRVNLYDLSFLANEEANGFQNFFNTLPMCIMEVRDGLVRFVRTNQSYRQFVRRFFGFDLSMQEASFTASPVGIGEGFMRLVKSCCNLSGRAFFDEQMPDGSIVHAFARRISTNPVTGAMSAAVAVLSIVDPDDGATYASIARALAADYYNIYCVDLDTERFIEYSSPIGGEELAVERHGENFFEACRRDAERICEQDREGFFATFTRENILRELERQGAFTTTYRLRENGAALHVNMKITRMLPGTNRIIIGISNIDAQMKQQEEQKRIRRELDMLSRLMALSEDYLSLYTVNPETGSYIEFNATDEYQSLGFPTEGEDFFAQALSDGEKAVCPEDLPAFRQEFTKEKVLRAVHEEGCFKLHYRLMLHGQPKPVSLKVALFKEEDEEKLVVSVRAWRVRHNRQEGTQ